MKRCVRLYIVLKCTVARQLCIAVPSVKYAVHASVPFFPFLPPPPPPVSPLAFISFFALLATVSLSVSVDHICTKTL